MTKRIALAALGALVAATGLGQAQAQYYRDEGYGRSYGSERPYEDDDRFERRPRDYGQEPRGYGRGPRPRMGSVCVTARGNCPAYPGPIETPCRCDIPGFGPKRGAILQ